MGAVGTFIDVFALATLELLSVRADAMEAALRVDANLCAVTVVSIVGAFVDVNTLVVNKHISGRAVFGTSPAAGSVGADFIRVTVVCIVFTFVDVDAFSIFKFVSISANTFKAG